MRFEEKIVKKLFQTETQKENPEREILRLLLELNRIKGLERYGIRELGYMPEKRVKEAIYEVTEHEPNKLCIVTDFLEKLGLE